MGLFSIFKRRRDTDTQPVALSAYDLRYGEGWVPTSSVVRSSAAGEHVAHSTAMCVPNYWACLNNRSEDGAKAPIRLRRSRGDGGADTLDDHAAAKLLRNPNPLMSEFTFRRTMQHYTLGWGNAYAEIVRDSMGRPTELWPIHPARMVPRLEDDGRTLVYEWRPDFKTAALELGPRDVFHLRGLGDGIVGYSVLQFHAESIGLAQAAQKHAAAFYGEGMGKRQIAVVKEALSPEGREGLRKRIMGDRERNPVGSRKIPILEGDVSIMEAGISPHDAQFLESRQFQIEEIARWFRMPLSQIQHNPNAKGWATNEQEFTWYVNGALMTDAHVWEQELEMKLLDDRERGTHRFEFVFTQLLRGDSSARMAYYGSALQNGILTRNEVRTMEGYNPADEPNAARLSVNSATVFLDEIGSGGEPGPDVEDEGAVDPDGEPDTEPEPGEGDDQDDEGQEFGDPEGDEDDDDGREGSAAIVAASLSALDIVFRDVSERLAQKERHALTRAIKKNGKHPAAFETWAGGFAERFGGEIVSAFAGAQEAAAQLLEAGGCGVDRGLVAERMAEYAEDATRLYVTDGLRELIQRDADDRAAEMAAAAIAAVRGMEGTDDA